jgi:cell division topological specificity factor
MTVSLSGIKQAFTRMFRGFFAEESASVAKNRLKLVLVHDRVKLSPQHMELLKQDLISAISKYIEIDTSQLEVSLTRSNQKTSLIVNIPVRDRKKEKTVVRRPHSKKHKGS